MTAPRKQTLLAHVIAGLALTFLVAAGVVRGQVRAGEVARVIAGVEVAHARVQAGEVLGWSGREIRWRAPSVCTPAAVTLAVQSPEGSEETLSVDVLPDARAGALAIMPGGAEGGYELQSASEEPLSFSGSPGTVEPLPPVGVCQHALWRLPEARWPSLAAAAAFAGSRLVAWLPLARSAATRLPVKAAPGEAVRVVVDGRAFFSAGGSDGLARVAIEVSPGVSQAEAIERDLIGRKPPIVAELNPPPPETDHVFARQDGSVWLLRMDARGARHDGVPPAGAEHVERGAFLLRRASELPIAAPPEVRTSEDEHEDEHEHEHQEKGEGNAAQSVASIATEASPRVAGWRAGAVATFNPTGQAGAALTLLRIKPFSPRLDVGWAGALFVTMRRFAAAASIEDTAQRWVGGLGAWIEVALPLTSGPIDWAPALGAGGAVAWRRIAFPLRTSDRVEVGPLGVASLRLGMRRVSLTLSVIASTAHVGSDPVDAVGMAGASLGW